MTDSKPADPSAGAIFGYGWLVRVEYNTEANGEWVDVNSFPKPTTLHGPFASEQEAGEFLQHFMEDDTDVYDMDVICFNKVR